MIDDTKNKLILAIQKFEDYAFLTDSLFAETYGIDESPIIAVTKRTIPRNGQLPYKGGIVKYRFHGNGCSFTFDGGSIVDFNYSPSNWQYEGISLFKFWVFLNDQIPELDDKEELERHLNELEKEGILIKVKPPYPIYRLANKINVEEE
jgi:hypothetical protein